MGWLLNRNIKTALPVPGTKVLAAFNYGYSLWGRTATMICKVPSSECVNYFLKVPSSCDTRIKARLIPPSQMITLGQTGKKMIQGEFESLKAIHATSPAFVPKVYAWDRFEKDEPETYFLLAEFRNVGKQPPDPVLFTARLAELHRNSVSPTWKFGFHTTTCHAKIPQITECWEQSWSKLYQRQLAHMVKRDLDANGPWPEFEIVCNLTLEKVVPRLLEPLQSDGRSIKPCLIHGDLWDENTATDPKTGEPFVFDACSMYSHNEYEIGDWRAPRHRLSHEDYVANYKLNFPASEPEEEWDDRNELYSLRYDFVVAILFPDSNLRISLFERMTRLCETYFPDELELARAGSKSTDM